MERLLRLALYILAAIGLGWLVIWGGGQLGFPQTPTMIAAAIVFILVVIFGFKATGTASV